MSFSALARIKALTTDASGQGSIGGSANKLSASAAVGDLVVVAVGFGLASSPSVTVTDSGGNAYTTLVRADKVTNNTPHSAIAYAILTQAIILGVDFLTVTFGSNVNFPIFLAYKSTPTVGAVVAADGSNSAVGLSTSPSSGSINTTGTDEIVVGAVCTGNPQTLANGTGWTPFDTHGATSTKALDGEYRIEAAPGTFTADGTIPSADWAACIAAFSATSPSVPTVSALNSAPRPMNVGRFA